MNRQLLANVQKNLKSSSPEQLGDRRLDDQNPDLAASHHHVGVPLGPIDRKTVLALQRTAGNRETVRFLSRRDGPQPGSILPLQRNLIQRETQLAVQQGPSCWLFVLEAIAKAKGMNTKYISMVMKAYPDSPEAVAKQKEEAADGRVITKRKAALELIVDNMTEMLAQLHNWKVGYGGIADGGQIEERIVRRYAKKAFDSDYSVNHLNFAGKPKVANVDGVIEEYSKAKIRARKLAEIVDTEEDDVGTLLHTGPQIIDKDQEPDDVHYALQVQDLPSYVRINKRFVLGNAQVGPDKIVDFTTRNINEMKDTAHAVLLDAYDGGARVATYKDPNYGDIKIKVTHLQFQAMAGDDKIKLRPFFRSGASKSKLAGLED